jgi:hypothetical protein
MLSEIEEHLIAQYFSNTLNDDEKLSFAEKIRWNDGNNDFAKAVKLQRTIELLLQKHPVIEARIIVEKLKKDLPTNTPDIVTAEEKSTYTLSELLQMFAPINELEEATTTRSAASVAGEAAPKTLETIVVLPENGVNCHDTLFFDLAEPIASPLLCYIYNNKREQLLAQNIAANEVSFDLALSLPPGRYYWELKPTNRAIFQQLGSAIGMFFVHEELMPQG